MKKMEVYIMSITSFESHLKKKELSQNSISSYLYTVNYFLNNYDLAAESLLEYKGYLVDNFKPKTVNLRIQALNSYFKFINRQDLSLQTIKLQQKTFLEDVVSYPDYLFLKRKLRNDSLKWHFLIWFLGATGARVGELVKFKVEHVQAGYFDIYAKGGKFRRIYIPKRLKNACLDWLTSENRTSGYLFLNRDGQTITARGVARQLKNYAVKYDLNPQVIYPHSFRHMYAKRFLDKHNDLALLADLMGHESIETTRIYLRRTASEQQALIDKIITW